MSSRNTAVKPRKQRGRKQKGKRGQKPTRQLPTRGPRPVRRRNKSGMVGKNTNNRAIVKRTMKPQNRNVYPMGLRKSLARGRDYDCLEDAETIGVIASNNSSNFGVLATYAINPGNSTTFPLLSDVAQIYEKYEFEYVEFYTIPEVSGFATGGQTGSYSLSPCFDAAKGAPGSYTAALDLCARQPAAIDSPDEPLTYYATYNQMHDDEKVKYVRTGQLPGQGDIHTYDAGNLFVCAEGLSATPFNVARLCVRYKCHFYDRIDNASISVPMNNSVSMYQTNGPEAAGSTGANTAVLFATTVANGLNIPNVSGSFTPPLGNYLVSVTLTGQNGSGSMTQYNINFYKNGSSVWPSQGGGGSGPYLDELVQGATISFTIFATANGTDVFKVISQANYSGGAQTEYGLIVWQAV